MVFWCLFHGIKSVPRKTISFSKIPKTSIETSKNFANIVKLVIIALNFFKNKYLLNIIIRVQKL